MSIQLRSLPTIQNLLRENPARSVDLCCKFGVLRLEVYGVFVVVVKGRAIRATKSNSRGCEFCIGIHRILDTFSCRWVCGCRRILGNNLSMIV